MIILAKALGANTNICTLTQNEFDEIKSDIFVAREFLLKHRCVSRFDADNEEFDEVKVDLDTPDDVAGGVVFIRFESGLIMSFEKVGVH